MKGKKSIAVLLGMALMLTLAGCGQKVQPSQTEAVSGSGTDRGLQEEGVTGPFERYKDTVTVTVACPAYTSDVFIDDDTPSDNPYTRYMLEKSNIDMEYAWSAAADEYDQKVSLAIASGDLPDIMLVRNRSQLQELVDNHMVEDLTGTYEQKAADYIKDFYGSYGEDAFTTAVYEDRLLAVPDLCYGYQFNFLWIRQDWLDRLGLDVPSTREELESVAKAFIDNDMSGNNDTIGIVCSSDVAGYYNRNQTLDPIFNTFDAYPRSWVIKEDGTVEYGSVQPGMKDALSYLSRLYQEGIIDHEFAVRTGDDLAELLLSGRSGITFGTWWYPDWPVSNAVMNDPECNWVPCLAPLSEDGKYHPMQQNYHENWLVVRKGYEHPEVVWELLNYNWQRGADKELAKIGEKYREAGGYIGYGFGPAGYCMVQYNDAVPKDAMTLKTALETGDTSKLNGDGINFYPSCKLWLEEKDPASWRFYAARVEGSLVASDENMLSIKALYYPATTATMSMSWSSMEDLENQMLLKIIIGEEEIDYFDEFVDTWNAMGGNKITQEVNEAYQKER